MGSPTFTACHDEISTRALGIAGLLRDGPTKPVMAYLFGAHTPCDRDGQSAASTGMQKDAVVMTAVKNEALGGRKRRREVERRAG
jgi:hypothetical protein